MATSSAMSTTNQYIKYTISITQNSQDIAKNTSNVTVKVRFYRTNTGYTTYGSGTVYCKINGTQYSEAVTPDDKITNSGIVLFTKTLNVSHGSDGAKKLTCSAWISHSQFSSSEQSYEQTLSTIYRASAPTVSASSVKMGNTLTITTNRKSSSFTHTLKYDFGPVHGATIKTGVGASYAWKVPDLAQYCNNATSGKCTITCITYNGSTKVGEESCDVTLNVPDASIPTATNVVMGNAVTVTTNRKSSNFTHTIAWSFGSKSGNSTNVSASTSFTASLDLAKEIPSKTSGEGTITCTTYNGTAKVGTNTCKFTATVPLNDTTRPAASWTITPMANYVPAGMEGLYIQGRTGVKVDFSASSAYSTISSYKMSVDGKTYTGDPATSQALNTPGNVVVNGTVTDARGYTRGLQRTISVLHHITPSIEPASGYNRIVCERSLQDGTYDDTGTYLHINCKVKHSPITVGGADKNICSLSYAVKAEGGSYGAVTKLFDTSTRVDVDTVIANKVSDATKSYTVKLIVEDAIGSSDVYYFTIPTADVTLNLAEGGGGAAFGKYAERNKALEIAEDWDFVMKGEAVADFIVEQGVSGIWKYRKWHSGIAECWGETETTGAFSTKWGNLFILPNRIDRVNYPFTFAERPHETVEVRSDIEAGIVCADGSGQGINSRGQTARYICARPEQTETVNTFKVDFFVIGRWK